MVPDRFTAVLARLTRDYREYFPEQTASPDVLSVAVLPRRLSDIARAQLAFGRTTTTLYIKVHKKPGALPAGVRAKAQLEFATLRDLHDKFRTEPGYAVVRPIAFFPDDLALVTEAADGDNLHGLIKRLAVRWRGHAAVERVASECRAAGAWLRRFQELTRGPGLAPPPVRFMQTRFEADLRACVAIGMSPRVADAIDGFVRAKLHGLERCMYPVVGVHPDFQPDNVLASPDRITVLDFTNFQEGPPHSDVARFLASVAFVAKSPLYAGATVRTLMRAFMTGYGRSVEEMNPALSAYVMYFVIRAASSAGSWRQPWPFRPLMHGQTVRFLTRWSQAIVRRGEFRLDD
jgi:hypothetical protein